MLRVLRTGQIFDSPNPLTSRERFASARYLSQARLAIGFIAFVLIWSAVWILPLGIDLPVRLLAIGLGYIFAFGIVRYRYTFWKRRPIRLRCRECREVIITNTPWVCGYCRKPNLNPLEFPFVDKCANPECGLEPKTYRCHHCNKFIFLTPDKDQINFAYRFNSQADITEADREAAKLKQDREKKRDNQAERLLTKKEEVAMAEVEKRLAELRKKIQADTVEASGPEIRLRGLMQLELQIRDLKKTVTVLFKDDEEMLERALAYLDQVYQLEKEERDSKVK